MFYKELIFNNHIAKVLFMSILTLFVLTSCSKPYEKYVGYWRLESKNGRSIKIMEISKNDKIYTMNTNILNDGSLSFALDESNDELSVNNGFMNINLKLSNDSTLFIANEKYTKISQEAVNEIKKNIDDCSALKKVYYDEREPYSGFILSKENEEKKNAIEEKYKGLMKNIPNCEILLYAGFL